MWQARHVQSRLAALYPRVAVEILGLTTEGDRRLTVSLATIGGKGLFVKELEEAMAQGRADMAVHSAKDVPAQLPEGYTLAAVLEREDPRDAFLSNRYRDLAALPAGARVGTSSLRRQCQLSARYPRLTIEPLRGNVDTRVRKLDDGRVRRRHTRRGGPETARPGPPHHCASRTGRVPACSRTGRARAGVPARPRRPHGAARCPGR